MLKATGVLLAFTLAGAFQLLGIIRSTVLPRMDLLVSKGGVDYRVLGIEHFWLWISTPFKGFMFGGVLGYFACVLGIVLVFLPRVRERVVLLCLSATLYFVMAWTGSLLIFVVFRLVKVVANM